jgi:solute carrier family 10 (sodium/bile acid cotransporter), member 7
MAARLKPDSFTIALAVAVGLAAVLPCRGVVAVVLVLATKAAIALLFFSHGLSLPRETVRAGLVHWRLHVLVLAATFVMFPLLGLALQALGAGYLSAPLGTGFLYLCIVPSTVQSSIALTALARGNVAAAVCSASLSSLVGVVATPALARGLGLTGAETSRTLDAVTSVAREIVLPFFTGQLLRPYLAAWVDRQGKRWRLLDQGSILLVVYTAFSAATVRGLWGELSPGALLALAPMTLVLLVAALVLTWHAGRALGFSREDQIAVVFCGSKKSLATGVPLANVLFPAHLVGPMVLPLMLFHQLQLLVGAALAQRLAARSERALNPGSVRELASRTEGTERP